MDKLLTTTEVAEITRTPVDSVRYWRFMGTGPRSFKLGRRVLYRQADVEAWISERAKAPAVDAHA